MDPRQKLLYIVYILGTSTSIGSLCTYDPMSLLAAVYRHCKIAYHRVSSELSVFSRARGA